METFNRGHLRWNCSVTRKEDISSLHAIAAWLLVLISILNARTKHTDHFVHMGFEIQHVQQLIEDALALCGKRADVPPMRAAPAATKTCAASLG